MAESDRIVDLKQERGFVEQYVRLRNTYCELLATNPVNAADTDLWLDRDDIEIRGIVRGEKLAGIAILYLGRNGEVTFFAQTSGAGLGGRLLAIIETAAKTRGLREVWAWVLSHNEIARRAFLKSGYRQQEESTRQFNDKTIRGFIFRKDIS